LRQHEHFSPPSEGGTGDDDDDADDSSSDEDDDGMDGMPTGTNVMAALRRMYRRSIQDFVNTTTTTAQSSSLSPSLRHAGCINTACWLADNDTAAPTKLMTSGDDRLLKIWNVKEAMDLAWDNGWDSFTPFATNTIRDHVLPNYPSKLPGTVELLHTFRTGHYGNVFHVTPLFHNHQQGGGGGGGTTQQLRALTSAADGALRLVEEQRSTLILQSEGMAYSHLVLTEHTGVVCYDNGLNMYDLRCSLHTQPDPVITGMSIKACVQYRPTLLFVGSSRDVKLIDIRVGRTSFFRSYQPSYFDPTAGAGNDDTDSSLHGGDNSTAAAVSVSGLDISKDNRSLLVSYESDQIYEFPICPNARSRAGPTMDEIDQPTQSVHETKCFGGHLNRFTFLKNAKYAGPNDEYVVTGSDSGRAWIFRRDTGTVLSLLGADKNTCNGVIPHPTLPYFITYGIESTAKLWRAAPSYKDDSRAGRYQAFREASYTLSPVTSSWSYVENHVKKVTGPPVMYPDFICSNSERLACQQFHLAHDVAHCDESPRIGNALLHLPSLLRLNRCECYRLCHARRIVHGRPLPLAQPVTQFSLTVLRSRLQFQADRLGATVDAECPWILRSLDTTVHPADLIPDFPSDWILLDKRLTDMNLMDLEDCRIPWLSDDQQTPNGNESFREKVITETAMVLKAAGNVAIAEEMRSLAVRRLDKAIQYCAVLCMSYLDNPLSDPVRPWSPLVQTLVTSRLNLSLALLTEHQADLALRQGQDALSLLLRYETNDETQKLRHKAHFRIGSAALASCDYEMAVLHLDQVGGECANDPVLKRRRTEARHRKAAILKRRRKKYQKYFDKNEEEKGQT
jgi:hypothetical protein